MNKTKRTVSLISMLMLLFSVFALSLAACDSGSNEYAEAEAAVSGELDSIRSGSREIPAMSGLSGEVSDELIQAYADKLRDFEYVIDGSRKNQDGTFTVTVDIKTYDFGRVYLETWKDRMKMEESLRDDKQFYNDLFTRFAAMSDKTYVGRAEVTCTKSDSGEWTTDITTDAGMLNALSGGLVKEMLDLSKEEAEAGSETEADAETGSDAEAPDPEEQQQSE